MNQRNVQLSPDMIDFRVSVSSVELRCFLVNVLWFIVWTWVCYPLSRLLTIDSYLQLYLGFIAFLNTSKIGRGGFFQSQCLAYQPNCPASRAIEYSYSFLAAFRLHVFFFAIFSKSTCPILSKFARHMQLKHRWMKGNFYVRVKDHYSNFIGGILITFEK